MKTKKVFLSFAIIFMVALLLIGGINGGIKRKPIEVREMANAQVIEYEEGDDLDGVNKDDDLESIIKDEKFSYGGQTENNESSDVKNIENQISRNSLQKVSAESVPEDITICIFGNAKLSLSPDRAKISACIQFLDTELDKAKENNFQAFEKLIEALKEIGIEESAITLTHFNCHPNYNYDCGRKIVGYYSTTSFTVKVEALDKIKDCVSVMTANGVTEINDIVYEVSNLDEEYSNALQKAVENSREKASKLLNRDDLRIVSVKEEHVYSCNTLYRAYAGDMSASDLVGKIEVEARVLVEFN